MSGVYDIAVLGAGPAGAQAALAAAEAGLGAALLDEQPQAGGQVWRAKSAAIAFAPPTPESRAGAQLRGQIEASGVAHLGQARVWQIARQGALWELQVLRGGASETVQAKALILAPGAREFVQPVPGWTLPGALGLAGATALLKQDLTVPGKRTVVTGTGPLVFYVASEIRRLGGAVAAVVTPNTRRDWMGALPAMVGQPALLARGAVWLADLMLGGVPVYWGHAVSQVHGAGKVEAAEVTKLDEQWAPQGVAATVAADSICMGHGLLAQVEAAQMLGAALRHDPGLGGWVPEAGLEGATTVPFLYVCGDGSGIRGAAAAAAQGRLTGLRAAADLGHGAAGAQQKAAAKLRKAARFGLAMTALSRPRAGLAALATDATIMCRCESLTRSAVLAHVQSGAQSANALKSGSRAGMGPCGGKFCQSAIAALIEQQTGQAALAPATPRPPLRPAPLGQVAGAFDYDALPIPKPAPL